MEDSTFEISIIVSEILFPKVESSKIIVAIFVGGQIDHNCTEPIWQEGHALLLCTTTVVRFPSEMSCEMALLSVSNVE